MRPHPAIWLGAFWALTLLVATSVAGGLRLRAGTQAALDHARSLGPPAELEAAHERWMTALRASHDHLEDAQDALARLLPRRDPQDRAGARDAAPEKIGGGPQVVCRRGLDSLARVQPEADRVVRFYTDILDVARRITADKDGEAERFDTLARESFEPGRTLRRGLSPAGCTILDGFTFVTESRGC